MEGCKYSDDEFFELIEKKLMISYGDGSKVIEHHLHKWENDEMSIEMRRAQDNVIVVRFRMK